MKQEENKYHFKSISQLLRDLRLPAPSHPLIALVDYSKVQTENLRNGAKVSLDFYKVSFKNEFRGQVKYGQGYYDFEEGGLAFLKPKQVVFTPDTTESYEGYVLYFHPDFIRNYPLGKTINQYGFFSYSVSEALFLSAKEKDIVQNVFNSIGLEIETNIDQYSQDVLVSQIELLLNYSNRYYNRQFITRKVVNHEIINRLDSLIDEYISNDQGLVNGLPSVQFISEQLNVSQRYLSDMLRSLTGYNTQQYIQNKILEYSKDLLSSTSLSISEIAYKLGFEHPQSFSKLFKAKTQQSPLAFRQKFN
ncbi:MAG: AraC family transcriptional regulator [Thalassobius sp.]|nr:AraC family transcriptional regulator [Thalassovita sp.]